MIRQYRPGDVDAVIAIWKAASASAYPAFDETFFLAESNRIRNEYLPTHQTWGWILDSRMVGFVSHQNDLIGGLFVAPECQKKGIGRALVEHVRRLNGPLRVDVFAANTAALAFYGTQGFRVVSSSRYPHTNETLFRLCQK